MCNLLHRTIDGQDRYEIDGLTVSRDVFEAYRAAGHPCSEADRLRLRLASAAPKRAEAGRRIVPQHDASGLDLFRHANEPRLI